MVQQIVEIEKKFVSSLSASQQQEFATCKLQDVVDAIDCIQHEQGPQKQLRNLARIQPFIETMDGYEQVVHRFLNATIGLGYIWGSIKFVLQLATKSTDEPFDALLDAYEEIGERSPSYLQCRALFHKNDEMRSALIIRYYSDISEFHQNAIQIFTRPMWEALFQYSWRRFEPQFRCILDSLAAQKSLLNSDKSKELVLGAETLHVTAENHSEGMKNRHSEADEEQWRLEFVIDKINPPNCHADQNAASEHRKEIQSGRWILQNNYFQAWRNIDASSNPLLYVNGIPGAGKTVLASFIIETLLKQDNGLVLFFYCKHQQQEKSTFAGILRGLLAQLLRKADATLMSWFGEKYSSLDQRKPGSPEILEELATFAFNSQRISLVVLDGLDECNHKEIQKTITWFVSHQGAHTGTGQIRLMCIGQRIDILQSMLSSATSISLDNSPHQNDIEKYIVGKSRNLQDNFKIDPDIVSQIVSRVTKTAKGMFLYAKLVMENLLRQRTQEDLMRELEPNTFPEGLEDAYGRVISSVLENVPQKQKEVASKIIGWVTCAKRPLKWREIEASLSIDHTNSTLAYKRGELRDCKWFCGSLVDLQSGETEHVSEAIITLVHETARGYLVQTGIINLSIQHANMALFCIEYLLSVPFRLIIPDDEIQRYATSGYYVLQDYAVLHWFDHLFSVEKLPVPASELDMYPQLLRSAGSFLKGYGIQSKLEDISKDEVIESLTGCLPRDLKTRTGFFDLEWRTLRIRSVIERLSDKCEPNSINDKLFQAFYGINRFKCPRIWCYYFTKGFNSLPTRDEHVRRHDRPFSCIEIGCPFYKLGFETEVRLNRHVTRNHPWADNNGFQFPQPPRHKKDTIRRAAERGDKAAVESFLAAGANIHDYMGGGTPLLLAAKNGHIGVCELLLNNGADVNFKEPRKSAGMTAGMTALHAAVLAGEDEVVRYLLTVRGIWLDEKAKGGVNSLHFAAMAGHLQIFEMLLNTGKVNIDARGKTPWPPRSLRTPIMCAVEMGHSAIVQMLLTVPNVKIDVQDEHGNTALHIAASHGYEAVLKTILSTGRAEVYSRNSYDETPLQIAAGRGHELIVQALFAIARTDSISNNTRLPKAIWDRDESEVIGLLYNQEINPDLKDEHGETSLITAVNKERLITAKLLVWKGADLEVTDRHGYTPLAWSAGHGYEAIVRLLVEKGAKMEFKGNDHKASLASCAIVTKMLLENRTNNLETEDKIHNRTSLLWAVNGNHATITELLLENGANLEAEDKYGYTALILAASYGYETMVNLLIEKGANLEAKDNEHNLTSLQWAVKRNRMIVTKLLLENGANLEAEDKYGYTALILAAAHGHERIVNLLIERGANMDSEDIFYKRTPVFWAMKGNHTIVTKLLLENGANFESEDRYGQTPLILAAAHGNEMILKLLVERGANLESKDNKHNLTALHWAVKKNYMIITQLLLENGANFRAEDRYGQTPLILAVRDSSEMIVNLLVETGANLESKDIDCLRTPLLWAVAGNQITKTKLLLKKGANFEAEDKWGYTALILAASHGYEAIVNLLIEKGANMESKDNEHNLTALQWAVKGNHVAVMKLLLENGANLEVRSAAGKTPGTWDNSEVVA